MSQEAVVSIGRAEGDKGTESTEGELRDTVY